MNAGQHQMKRESVESRVPRRRSRVSAGVIALVGALGLLLGACTDDYGTPCNFPASPEVTRACAANTDSDGNTSRATCVDSFNADCESRLCIQFEGQAAYCSQTCSAEADCPSGSTCVSDENATISAFCVPDDILAAD
jgi:hypothetical protein